MTEELKVSQRDAVMRERAAFLAGVEYRGTIASMTSHRPSDCRKCSDEVQSRYPLPAVALGIFAGREYRLRDGVLEYRTRTQTPICGGDAERLSPHWDRASLQPDELNELVDALGEAD